MSGSPGQGRRTWDGEPVSSQPPFGATIVVSRRHTGRPTFLLLHRGHYGPDFAGDWAWGPPSGARFPGEAIERCAQRELFEETGLRLSLARVDAGQPDWFVYVAEAPDDAEVRLSAEHDAYAWLSLNQAVARTRPDNVRVQLVAAAREAAADPEQRSVDTS